MASIKDDIAEIINQDLMYVRKKVNALRNILPHIVRHPLETGDDLITKWSVRSGARPKKPRRWRNSNKD